jgi:heterodisulfide reductase subunit B2
MTQTADIAKKYAYFPGCSQEGSSAEYNDSTHAVFARFGITFEEIPDWSCCGATSAHNVNHDLSPALSMRNLALAEPLGLDIVTPCASCYNRLKVAETSIRENPELRKKIANIIEKDFNGGVTTLNTLDLVEDHLTPQAVREKVVKKLTGLKVVCYYGCLTARPPEKLKAGNPDNPTSLDNLMEWLGADPRFWTFKTDCCGAGHTIARADIVRTLVGKLHDMAREAGADAIVTACPMCLNNIDMRQDARKGNELPVFFFTELMALAMGMSEANGWFRKRLTSPLPLLQRLNLI